MQATPTPPPPPTPPKNDCRMTRHERQRSPFRLRHQPRSRTKRNKKTKAGAGEEEELRHDRTKGTPGGGERGEGDENRLMPTTPTPYAPLPDSPPSSSCATTVPD